MQNTIIAISITISTMSIIIIIKDLLHLYLNLDIDANTNDINVHGITKLSGKINAIKIEITFVIKHPRAKLK